MDRSVKSGHNPSEEKITIQVMKKCVLKGVEYSAGETFKVTKSEARKLFELDRKAYRAVLD